MVEFPVIFGVHVLFVFVVVVVLVLVLVIDPDFDFDLDLLLVVVVDEKTQMDTNGVAEAPSTSMFLAPARLPQRVFHTLKVDDWKMKFPFGAWPIQSIPRCPCMVDLPAFTIRNKPNVGKYKYLTWMVPG